MLAKSASVTEQHRLRDRLREALRTYGRDGDVGAVDLIALSINYTMERVDPVAVIVPTRSGATARNVARFRLPVWITAFSPEQATCQALQFSYGVNPVHVPQDLAEWDGFAREWLREQGITSGVALLSQGPSELNPSGNYKMEILDLARTA